MHGCVRVWYARLEWLLRADMVQLCKLVTDVIRRDIRSISIKMRQRKEKSMLSSRKTEK